MNSKSGAGELNFFVEWDRIGFVASEPVKQWKSGHCVRQRGAVEELMARYEGLTWFKKWRLVLVRSCLLVRPGHYRAEPKKGGYRG